MALLYNEQSEADIIAECTCTLEGGCYNTGGNSYCKIQDGDCDYSYCSYLCSSKCNSDVFRCNNDRYSGFRYGWGCLDENGNQTWD